VCNQPDSTGKFWNSQNRWLTLAFSVSALDNATRPPRGKKSPRRSPGTAVEAHDAESASELPELGRELSGLTASRQAENPPQHKYQQKTPRRHARSHEAEPECRMSSLESGSRCVKKNAQQEENMLRQAEPCKPEFDRPAFPHNVVNRLGSLNILGNVGNPKQESTLRIRWTKQKQRWPQISTSARKNNFALSLPSIPARQLWPPASSCSNL
jgi:hypothetical protein